jgi:alanine racemase
VEVDAGALRRNLETIRTAVGEGVGMVPMVKADAYGTGVADAVPALERTNPWGYGVATVPEGLAVRALGMARPILGLSPSPRGDVRAAVEAGLTLCISEVGAAREVESAAMETGIPATIHAEVDTGMGRAGFNWRQVVEWGAELLSLSKSALRWEGVFTHFHSADGGDPTSTSIQAERFAETVRALQAAGWERGIVHLNNSAGALRRPDLAQDLVRPGIFLYGGRAGEGLPEPEEVVRVCARIVLEREVSAGTTLGYGATYSAARSERWATLGIGYGDGLPRSLGNRGSALFRGRRVPIVGRISMDLTVVDITDVPGAEGAVGEIVTLIGSDGESRIPLDEVAALAGTIGYEVLTGLTARLRRVWTD